MHEVETKKGQALSTETEGVKRPYQKPESTVVKLELEQPLLNSSPNASGGFDWGDGGFW